MSLYEITRWGTKRPVTKTQSREWYKLRTFLVNRRGKCAECGSTDIGDLTAHHIIPRADGGSNRPDNILIVCRACHDRIHDMTPNRPRKISP